MCTRYKNKSVYRFYPGRTYLCSSDNVPVSRFSGFTSLSIVYTPVTPLLFGFFIVGQFRECSYNSQSRLTFNVFLVQILFRTPVHL